MPAARCDDKTFIELFDRYGAAETAKRVGGTERNAYARRRRLETKLGVSINSPSARKESHPHRIELEIQNGVVLVGGDAHYWPGPSTTAHRAFVQFIKEMKPVAVIMNGDVFDGASISRHPPIGWESQPSVQQEIEAAQDRMHEVERAAGRARKIWPLGNHDSRYETRLATVAPEYAKVHGMHLSDHFPLWEKCWSVFINGDVAVKHRFRGGIHATHNNTLNAGITIVTNHLHSLKVTPFSDYATRPRWGVDAGCLADPHGAQFRDYGEDNPRNHRSGFAVLTFRDGVLLWPEVVHVFDQSHVEFRGQLHEVAPEVQAVQNPRSSSQAKPGRRLGRGRRAGRRANRSRK